MGEGQHILFLDDDEEIVYLGARILERHGYQVSGFTRVADALEAFRANPGQFHLVVTDMRMAGASGLEVAAELLAIRPELPILLCSGHVSEELRKRARDIGIREVVYKPTTIREFGKIIHHFIAGGAVH